ncbi:MAG: MFS transporter [Actinomycetota bacterium]
MTGEATMKSSSQAALAHRDFRYLLAGMAVSQTGDWLYGVALLVFVFEQTHSAAWVAGASIVRFLPVIVLGPAGGVVADRFERRTVMIVADIVRAGLMFLLAAIAAASGSALAAIVISMLSTIASTAYRPALAAMTPSVVPENHLAAANSVISAVEYAAIALGPAVGGALLLLGSPVLAFGLNGITFLVSLLTLLAVRTRSQGTREEEAGFWSQVTEGLRAVVSSTPVTMLFLLLFAGTFLYGHELVLLLLVSQERLGTGSDGLAYLMAAIGVGGILAAVFTGRLNEASRPAPILLAGALLSAASLVALSFVTSPVVAVLAMTLDGAGAIVLDVVTVTVLQRVVASDMLGRIFGVLGSVAVAGMVAGSLVAPAEVSALGLKTALWVPSGFLVIVAFIAIRGLRRVEATLQAAETALAPRVQLLRDLHIFDGASPVTLERIARDMKEERVACATTVVREGEPAHDFFVVAAGTLTVLAKGEATSPRIANRLEAGDYFGEIGLLERMPRTATVRAATDCILYRIGGKDFLSAVTQAPVISGALLGGVMRGLANTHPSHRVTTPPTAH